MKKICFFMIMTTIISISSNAMAFTDTKNHWASETIENMADKKVLNGYVDATFKPDNSMTRAEFITLIDRLLGLKETSDKYIPDIKREDWYSDEVRRAVKAEIVQGDAQGYIRPNDKITREEAVIILARSFKIQNVSMITTSYNDKDDISSWAKDSFISFIKYGYITGYADNTIKPQNNITRAEIVTIINRMIPNILTSNIYEENLSGNTLVFDNNVILNNLTINGDLIISGGVFTTLKINNVELKSNLITTDKIPENILKNVKLTGKIYSLYENLNENERYYENNEYGIKFSIPKAATVEEITECKNYDIKDLILISIEKKDENYIKSLNTLANNEIQKYDNLFKKIEENKLKNANYVLYDDENGSQMLVIKRDDIVYTFIFFNIESENLVDNVLSTIELFENDKVVDIKKVEYKNAKLSLKFNYFEKYVSVDDSYNTGIINNDEAFFKLFIQVTQISDMDEYTFLEIKALLKELAKKDGEILNSSTLKVMNNDAVKFEIKNEDRLMESLYVVIGKNLYKFIFIGDEEAINEVGKDNFNKIINSLEF